MNTPSSSGNSQSWKQLVAVGVLQRRYRIFALLFLFLWRLPVACGGNRMLDWMGSSSEAVHLFLCIHGESHWNTWSHMIAVSLAKVTRSYLGSSCWAYISILLHDILFCVIRILAATGIQLHCSCTPATKPSFCPSSVENTCSVRRRPSSLTCSMSLSFEGAAVDKNLFTPHPPPPTYPFPLFDGLCGKISFSHIRIQ